MSTIPKPSRFKVKRIGLLNRLFSALLLALMLIGQPATVLRVMAAWTPLEGSVPAPAVLTVNAFAAQDLSGAMPQTALVLAPDGALYGATIGGGTYGHGTLFKVAASGAFTKLHDFNDLDGSNPDAALVVGPDGALYGSTTGGGTSGAGTLFKLATDGTFTKLHDFDGTDGGNPRSALALAPDGAFYGSTEGGGANEFGVLFKLEIDGTFTKLHDFSLTDGIRPEWPLVVGPDGALYGSTALGGQYGQGEEDEPGVFGTLFRLETDGPFTKLHDFDGANGAAPRGSLVVGPDGALYGSTDQGGVSSFGVLFKLETDGTFAKLHDFSGLDGIGPYAALVVGPDGALYGGTMLGGTSAKGTLFKRATDGTFTKLHDFNGSDGSLFRNSLVVGQDGFLYGSTMLGGANDFGTLFKLEPNGTFTKLHEFDGVHGDLPLAALVMGDDGALHGSTLRGGVVNLGTLFKLETGGTFTRLHDFSSVYIASPQSPLAVGPDGALYGTTLLGGVSGLGTLFKLEANGTFTRLHQFNGADGAHPSEAALVLGLDGALYGSTPQGGTGGYGTVFKVTADGTFTKLHDFNGTDGRHPSAALVVGADGSLYGSTVLGGTSDFGTLFKVAANGTFTKLHDFDGADGAEPRSALVLGSDGVLYGVTSASGGLGASNSGTLFKLETNGTFTKFHDFTGPDGYDPAAGLVLGPDGAFYGSTQGGGVDGQGTLFKLEINGTFTKLHDFTATDGEEPSALLAVGGDGALYGSTPSGGTHGFGTLFKLSTNGTFTKLHDFSNDGGQYPQAALVVGADGALYGSTPTRSGGGAGTLFKLAADGAFTHLHNFNTVNGKYPLAAMVVGPDGALYGSTQNGGPLDGGILFKLVLPPVQQTPLITWANPATIVVGTPLGGTQLNATASFNGSPVAGTFTYNPSSGTLLPVGNSQALAVEFTPADSVHYTAANAAVSINVVPVNHAPVIGNSLPDSITGPFGGGFGYGPAANTFIEPDAGQTLTITATGMPPGITFDPVTFSFSGVSEVPGEFEITLTATDNGIPGLSVQDTMIFIITRLGQATDFNPNAGGTVFSTAVQPDGKIVIGGGLNTVGGVARVGVARVNADGSLDTAFNPDVNSFTYSTAVQADGRIVVGGSFTNVGGSARNRIARINADGTLDTGFNPNASGPVYSLALQPDGKVVVVGQFTTVGGAARNRIARLHADGTLDTGFNPDANDYVVTSAVQPDGKIVIGGGFTSVGGTARNRIVRLNANGTVDSGFNPNVNNEISSIALQADGKIVFGGQFSTVGGNVRYNLARLNADGTLDSGFNPNVNSQVASIALQADGQIVIGGHFTTVGGIARNRIALLYSNGTLAPIFNPNANDGVHNVALQADGQILVGGQFTTLGGQPRNRFARLFNDPATQNLTVPSAARVQWLRGGSAPEASHVTFELSTDGTTWTALGSGTRISGGWELTGLGLPSDGIIRARARTHGGQYNGGSGLVEQQTAFSGLPVPDIALELGVGTELLGGVSSIDFGAVHLGDGFSPPTLTIHSLGGLPLTVSAIETIGGNAGDFSVRLITLPATLAAAGGSATFEVVFQPTAIGPRTTTLRLLSNDPDESPFEIALTGVGIVDGLVDAGFNPAANSVAIGLAVQPDGKSVIGGAFSSVGGAAHNYVARLNSNGTADAGFNPTANNSALSLAIQDDGRIVIGGFFTTVGGSTRNYIARLNADGSLDSGFDPNANGFVFNTLVQADGKVVIAGLFSSVAGTARYGIARLHADGALDGAFYPNPNNSVYSAALQSDGKILIGGVFDTVGGVTRNRIARLNADGTLDSGFNPNANNSISSVAAQADGKILIGGVFTTVGGATRNRFARLNADGTLDAGFNPNVDNDVFSIVVQADGKILIGGSFNAVAGVQRDNLARLNADGSLDGTFDPSADGTVAGLALQNDGQVLVAGYFTEIDSAPRNHIARLLNGTATQSLSVPNAARVEWLRGGTAPEATRVTFELSTDGSTWTPLGSGSRIGGGWELTGLNLPADGTIRARARTAGGRHDGSSGLVEQQTTFSGLPPLPELAVEFGVGTYLVDGVSSIDFGAVNVGDGFSPPTLTVRSLGRAPLNVSAIETTGGNAFDFVVRLFTVPTPLPGTLAAGGGAGTFEVLFQPTAGGPRSATLRILSNDPDESPFEIALTGVGIPNSPPSDIALNNASVSENQPVATAVGSLTATDPNAGNIHAFTLVSGAGDVDNAFFSIAGNELRTAAVFNFEARNSFSIRVRATDNRGLSYDEALAVSVLNVNDRPVANPQSVTTGENTPVAITLTGTDEENGLMSFAIVSDPVHGTLSGSAPNVVYTPALDYSGPDSFTFLLSDGALASTAVTVSITVNAVALIPEIDALSPSSAIADGPAFTLTVTGENFDAGTIVHWNGAARPTTYFGAGQVTAEIPSTDLVADGDFSIALITVTRSSGILSDPVAFTIIGTDVGGAIGEVDSGVAVAGNAVSVETLPSAADSPGVMAYFENTEGTAPATVTVATYTENPTGANAFETGGGFVDLKVSGADVGDYLQSSFYYPQTVGAVAEASIVLQFFNGTSWIDVLSSGGIAPDKDTTDDLDGTVSGGRFDVVFDDTSTPMITELNGTVFAVAVPDTTPPVIQCPADLVIVSDRAACDAGDHDDDDWEHHHRDGRRRDAGEDHSGCREHRSRGDDGAHGYTCRHWNRCRATGVVLTPPVVTDNGVVASVVNNHPSMTYPLGVTLVIWTATDANGNVSTCVQRVTVVASVEVSFRSPLVRKPTHNTIRRGQVVPFKVELENCLDQTVRSGVTVKLQVQGIDSSTGSVFQDVIEDTNGLGTDGTVTSDGLMQYRNGQWQFNLDTSNFGDPNTVAGSRFYRTTVTVIDNATLAVLGLGTVNLETSRR